MRYQKIQYFTVPSILLLITFSHGYNYFTIIYQLRRLGTRTCVLQHKEATDYTLWTSKLFLRQIHN